MSENITLMDRAIGWLSPKWGAERLAWRNAAVELSQYRPIRNSRLDRSPAGLLWYSRSDSEKDVLRAKAKQLDYENVLVESLLDRAADNVVGTGFKLQVRTESEPFNTAAENRFNEWADRYCDVRGLSSFNDLIWLAFRSMLRDGDYGLILLKNGQLQGIEGAQFSNIGAKDPANTEGGVETNDYGRPVRFHVQYLDGYTIKTEPIDAENMVYLVRRKSFLDTRGTPCFSTVFHLFEQIDGYIEAVVVAARMAACFGLTITGADAGRSGLPLITNSKGEQQQSMTLEPGMIRRLAQGDTVQQIKPEQPNQQFGDYLSHMMRLIGLPLGMPLELAFLDFSRTNYSSARASLLQAYRTFQRHQQNLKSRVLRRIYRWWVSKNIKGGFLPEQADAFNHEWIAPGWAWVDPEKEVISNLMAIDAGMSTLSMVAANQGYDLYEMLKQRQRELKMMNDLEIPVMHSTGTRSDEAAGENNPLVRSQDNGDGENGSEDEQED